MPSTGSRARTAPAAIALVVALCGAWFVSSAPVASAEAPPAAVGEFHAPLCPGETTSDPTASGPDFQRDLTLVSGARLDAYNAGLVVPLYDNTGHIQEAAVPPLCGVRFSSDTQGPVSEWMFCTDADGSACNDLLEGGRLADQGVEIPFPEAVGATRFDERQENAIKALVAEGYTTVGFAGAPLVGRSDGTVAQRYTLQSMVWCVSDDQPHCWIAFMDDSDIDVLAARGAALAPSASVAAPTGDALVGETLTWSVTTNVVGTPLDVVSDVPVTVCSSSPSPATLTAGVLVVDVAAGSPATVELCGLATTAGAANLTVGRAGAGTRWVQSSIAGTTLAKECQVYSLWEQEPFTASATASVVTAPTPTPTAPVTPEPTGTPTTDVPSTDAPSEEPTTGAPSDEPTTDVPADEPTTDVPADEPTTDVPADEPTTEASADEPGSDAPSDAAVASTGDDAPIDSDVASSGAQLARTGAGATVTTLTAAALLAVAGVALLARRRQDV